MNLRHRTDRDLRMECVKIAAMMHTQMKLAGAQKSLIALARDIYEWVDGAAKQEGER